MSTKCAAVIVPGRLSEAVRIESLEVGEDSLRELVGGDIEVLGRGDWQVYLNAEGRLLDLPTNIRARPLMYESGFDPADAARGTAVFLGPSTHDQEADIPEHLIRRAEELFGVPAAA